MQTVLDYFQATVPRDAKMVLPFNLQRLNPETAEFHCRNRALPITPDLPSADAGRVGEREFYLTVVLDDGSLYQKEVVDDSLESWNAWIKEQEMRGNIRLYSSRRFDAAGVTAVIYEKTPSSI
jgi:hypothetical protein